MIYDFNIDSTGDVVVGDIIEFTEKVWGGSFKNPYELGKRIIIAKVIKDSYGKKKQQHTFTIEIIKSSGYNSLEEGIKTTRKGRNIYRFGTKRLLWKNENNREDVASEKHKRGQSARQKRAVRREYELSHFL